MLGFNLRTAIKCIDGKWYAFAYWESDVYSIGSDCPRGGGQWFARCTDSGIKYVASASPTRKAAYNKARRYGNYTGEW